MCVRVSVFTCGASEPKMRVCLRVEWREGGRDRKKKHHKYISHMPEM